MKKAVVAVILSLIFISAAFSLSLRNSDEVHPFDSIPMLESYYDESDDGSMSFWDGCEISLLTIGSGDPLYSWFGHSAFLVSTPDGRNVTFDYGTFSFNDEDFFEQYRHGCEIMEPSVADTVIDENDNILFRISGTGGDGRLREILFFCRSLRKEVDVCLQ